MVAETKLGPLGAAVVVGSNHHIPCDDQMAEDQEDQGDHRDSCTVRILLLWDREEVHNILYLVVVVVVRGGMRDRAVTDFVDVIRVGVCDNRLDGEDSLLIVVAADHSGNMDHLDLCVEDIVTVVVVISLALRLAVVETGSTVVCNQVNNLQEEGGYPYTPDD
jgi:hypothetical protein